MMYYYYSMQLCTIGRPFAVVWPGLLFERAKSITSSPSSPSSLNCSSWMSSYVNCLECRAPFLSLGSIAPAVALAPPLYSSTVWAF